MIGGGPAGTSAAITSVRGGATVLLLERGRFPRHKVCGEFVSAESLDLLGNLLAPQYARLLSAAIRIPQSRIFLDGVCSTRQSIPQPPALRVSTSMPLCGIRRKTVAWIAGNKPPCTVFPEPGPFLVKTSAGDFESRALIIASGRWSNLTSAFSDGADSRLNGSASKDILLRLLHLLPWTSIFLTAATAECNH